MDNHNYQYSNNIPVLYLSTTTNAMFEHIITSIRRQFISIEVVDNMLCTDTNPLLMYESTCAIIFNIKSRLQTWKSFICDMSDSYVIDVMIFHAHSFLMQCPRLTLRHPVTRIPLTMLPIGCCAHVPRRVVASVGRSREHTARNIRSLFLW